MKKLFTLAALVLTVLVSAQESGKDFTYKPLKWTIKTPVGYEKGDSHKYVPAENEVIIYSVAKANGNEEETMVATITPYSEEKDGKYSQFQELTAKQTEDALRSELELDGFDLDVKTDKETISGKEFYHYTYIMTIEYVTVTSHIFYSLIDGKNFCMVISYLDNAEGQKMLKAFRESKFK